MEGAEGSRRIGLLTQSDPSDLARSVESAGGEPVSLAIPEIRGEWGVALVREWISDRLEVSTPALDLDALIFDADSPEELAAFVIDAIRLKLPSICLSSPRTTFSAAVAALGLSAFDGDPVEVALELAENDGPSPENLVDEFALANALRVGLSVGGGQEVVVHLAAIAREAGVTGFDKMIRVISPDTPAVASIYSEWFDSNGLPAVLALLGEELHDASTVSGSLKSHARTAEEPLSDEETPSLSFIKARTSGAEAVCLVPPGITEVEGECRVFDSEVAAVAAVAEGEVDPSDLIVVRGCGPRGGLGLWRLDELSSVVEESENPETFRILTDGLAPEEAPGVWLSLFSPEAATRGIIGRLQDGDLLRFDFVEGRILTSIDAKELARRTRFKPQEDDETPAYAARYIKSALPPLQGAAFR